MSWTPQQIKDLRKHLGWNQSQLAEYLGYGIGGKMRVSELERNVVGVSGPVGRLLDLLAEKHEFQQ